MGQQDHVLLGVIGFPVHQSKSPDMHHAALRELGIKGNYVPLNVAPAHLETAIRAIVALDFRGVNVTMPYKVDVLPMLDQVDSHAQCIGAVNTIVNEEGTLIGYNTDGIGYVRSLKEEAVSTLEAKTVVVIGAGGAARAICYALVLENIQHLYIMNRTAERAQRLATHLNQFRAGIAHGAGLDQAATLFKQAHVVIQTTSVGMASNFNALCIDVEHIPEEATVSDIVYYPFETSFLQACRRKGCQVHSGLGMFVHQGAFALQYWVKQTAPVDIMRAAVLQSML